jgi:hypothetical protein
MFFTKLGRVLAWLAFVGGAVRLAMGFLVASSGNHAALAPRYLGSSTSGEAIDQGIMVLVFGVALGILVEISRTLQSRG